MAQSTSGDNHASSRANKEGRIIQYPKFLDVLHCQVNSTRKVVEQIYTNFFIASVLLISFAMFCTLLGETDFVKSLCIYWFNQIRWNVLGRVSEHSAKHQEEIAKGPSRNNIKHVFICSTIRVEFTSQGRWTHCQTLRRSRKGPREKQKQGPKNSSRTSTRITNIGTILSNQIKI